MLYPKLFCNETFYKEVQVYQYNKCQTLRQDRERQTPNREVLGSIPTSEAVSVLEQDTLTPYSTG